MLKSNKSISIVIPTYNNIELFVNAINSILNQTILPDEIIVSDDSSSDYIERWCADCHNPIIKYYRNRPTKGAVVNWNWGINQTTKDWIILMHHDEEFMSSNYLESLCKHFEDADVIISDIRVNTLGKIRKGRINGLLKKCLIQNPLSFLIVNSIGPCACVCFKRRLLIEFDTHLTWLVDTEWYMRLLKSSKHVIYDSELIILSNHGHIDQITKNIDINEKLRIDLAYLNKKYRVSSILKYILRLSMMYHALRRSIKLFKR